MIRRNSSAYWKNKPFKLRASRLEHIVRLALASYPPDNLMFQFLEPYRRTCGIVLKAAFRVSTFHMVSVVMQP